MRKLLEIRRQAIGAHRRFPTCAEFSPPKLGRFFIVSLDRVLADYVPRRALQRLVPR